MRQRFHAEFTSLSNKEIDTWVKMCLSKKKLNEYYCDLVVKQAKKQGKKLRYYFCPHCSGYHITSQINEKRHEKV
jgi:hypothetical protein